MKASHPTRSERLVVWLVHHRWLVLLVAMLVGALCTWRTVLTYAALRSDLEELLPKSAPSVAALQMMRSRLSGLRFLGVVVDTGGPEHVAAANRFVDELCARIREYPPELVGSVRKDIAQEKRFLERHALQLMDPNDVRELREAVERRRDWEVTHALDLSVLDEEEDPKPEIPVEKLRRKYESKHGKPRTFPGDRFVSDDGHTVVAVVRASSHATSYEADSELLSRIERDISDLGFPEAYGGGMRVGFAGDVPTRVEEMDGLFADLAVSGAIVALLVVGALLLYFGSWRALPVLFVPLLLGTVSTFGLVALPPLDIRHLNTNTAFLGSIVVGNGINSGIILLARFCEERQSGRSVDRAIVGAVQNSWRPTLAAALAAASAYGCLVFTDFRGFSQFGWIGGIGMVTCWVATMLLAPPLIHWFGARLAGRDGGFAQAGHVQHLLGVLLSRPRLVVGITAALTLVTGAGLIARGWNWLEHDYSKLRRRDSYVDGERYWGRRMDDTLQRYLTPTVIMTGSAEQARVVEANVRELMRAKRAGGLIGSVRSASQVLPDTRGAALVEARKLRAALTPRLKSELSPEDRRMVEAALTDSALREVAAQDVPEVLVAGFREHDGRLDRTVLVYPRLSSGTWDGTLIREFTDDLRAAAATADPEARVAGPLTLSSDITAAMAHDGPRATVLGLLAALVICALAFGSVRLSVAAVASLLVGVVMMMGGLGWTDARLNFANFVVLPITFGISADYAINVLRRYQADGKTAPGPGVASTGGAVAMCSATTIIGFGSLLAAKNQALFSFGVFAVAGEVTMLATAAVALPAALALRERRREVAGSLESPPGVTP